MPAQSAVRDRNASDFQLIETLRWGPACQFIRLERHFARLYASACELGFACDPQRVGEVLATVGAGNQQRVRLALSRNGDVAVGTQPYEPASVDTIWTLGIATTRIASSDVMLRHKTTQRGVYDAARAEFSPKLANEVLLLNERDELCEGTITSLFISQKDGPLVTPNMSCGQLPGVLRQTLLETGKVVEGVIKLDDLRRSNAIFVGNSLRGLIRARLADLSTV